MECWGIGVLQKMVHGTGFTVHGKSMNCLISVPCTLRLAPWTVTTSLHSLHSVFLGTAQL